MQRLERGKPLTTEERRAAFRLALNTIPCDKCRKVRGTDGCDCERERIAREKAEIVAQEQRKRDREGDWFL